MRANAEAFRRRRIVPRMLRDVAERDLSTTVLGTAMPAPLMLAPIGVQQVVHEEGELATARAAAAVGVPMIASTASPLHARGDRRGGRRGARAGSSSTGPTTPACSRASSAAPRRPATARSSSPSTPSSPAGSRATCSRPGSRSSKAWASPTTSRTRSSAPRLEQTPEEDLGAATGRFLGVLANPSLTWDDLARLRELTSLPILVKGIQHVDDAREAAQPRHRRHRRLQPRRPPGRRRDRLARRPGADRRGRRRRARGPLRQRRPRRRRRAQGARPRRRRRLPRPPLRLGPGPRRPGRGRNGAEDGPRRARPDDGHRPLVAERGPGQSGYAVMRAGRLVIRPRPSETAARAARPAGPRARAELGERAVDSSPSAAEQLSRCSRQVGDQQQRASPAAPRRGCRGPGRGAPPRPRPWPGPTGASPRRSG